MDFARSRQRCAFPFSEKNFFNGGILAVGCQDNGEGFRVVSREQLRILKESAKFLIEDELQEFDDLQDSR